MTLNGVMAVTLRYFTEFGKHTFQLPTHNRRVDLWRNLCTSLLYFVVRVRCRRKESSCTFAISSPDEFLVSSAVADRISNTSLFTMYVSKCRA